MVHSLWVHPKYTWSRNDVGSSKSTYFIKIFQVGPRFSVFPASFISSTYTDKNNPLARLTNKQKLLPNRVPVELSRIAFPLLVLPEGNRTNYFREERLGLPYWTMILAICFGRRIQISAHCDFRLMHLPFWPEFKQILHPLLVLNILEVFDLMSMTLTAVICDVDPCSVNTA